MHVKIMFLSMKMFIPVSITSLSWNNFLPVVKHITFLSRRVIDLLNLQLLFLVKDINVIICHCLQTRKQTYV